MHNREPTIRIDALKKELSNIQLVADDVTISQKTLKLCHLTEQSLRQRLSAKRKDLMLSLLNLLHHSGDAFQQGFELSLKLCALIISYQFFKKSIPLEIKHDPFEKNLLKVMQRLSRAETARNNKLHFR